MRQLILVLLCTFFISSLSMPVYNGVYKRDTACGNGCDCWDEAQVTFEDNYAVPMFLFNGTYNGDCQGQISYAETNYTYNSYSDSESWYYFYQDEQNGYVNVTGGPFCSYGNYTITTSTSYWNNQTQYWQKNLMIINDAKPYCSYHMKNITKPAYQQPPTPTPAYYDNYTSPIIFEGIYNRSEPCQCCCWNEVQIIYEGGLYPTYLFNGTFSGEHCGTYYSAMANLSFYGSSNRFHRELNQNYLNLDGRIGDYEYYYNSQNWTIFLHDNSSITFTDKINGQCSYTLANITDEYYNNLYNNYNNSDYYNNDTDYSNSTNYDNNTDYSNSTNYDNNTDYDNTTNDYPYNYEGQYGPVENISNPRVLNGQYNLSGQCPSECACFENMNITFDYMPWIQYIGYNFQGTFGEYYSYANFSASFNGTYNDLVNELGYQFVNVTNYTIVINYYNNYSTEYYNYGKRAQEITINYWWTNCSYSLVRIGDPYVQYEEEPIYQYSNDFQTDDNDTMFNNYTNSSSSNYTYDNSTYPNYTYTNDSSSSANYNNVTVYSPYDFDGYYSRSTNCPEGCCCYNFVSVNYVQYDDYLNTFLLNGTYSGSGCPAKKSYQPVNFTYIGQPQNMFWNFTSQGYAPFLEAWIGNYGSNYTFSLNITDTNDFISVYNVNQPQCTYTLENITYYVPPSTPVVNNYTNNNSYNNASSNNNSNNNYNYPSTDGVFDYFDGNYRINTPCDYQAGCGCWSDVSLTNFDADSDNDEPYFILNGTYRSGRNNNYAYKTEKLYYPATGMYASSVTLNSENNGTVITVNTGDSHYNPNTQYYYNDIQIQNTLQPDCYYNLTNLTGLNQGYDDIQNSVQLQLGKLSGRLRV